MLAALAAGGAVIAAIPLVVGFGRYGLGQILERLLNGEASGES